LATLLFLTGLQFLFERPPQSPNLAGSARINIPKEEWQVVAIIEDATIYAYSSTKDQTDDDPFIGAHSRVFLGMVANNCLKAGTVVEIFGWRYRVLDRMNKVHGCKDFDIWHPTRQQAKQFGVKRGVTVEILKRAGQ
jgi:3D (Asp-Asp-Asp) domain-containing protein